jgi:hypothetical protein
MGNEILFGSWLLKHCEKVTDADIIYWKYEGKDYTTEDLYTIFLKYYNHAKTH